MTSSPAIDAARNFLGVIWEGDVPNDETILASLDRLVAIYHDTPDAAPSDTDFDTPDQDWAVLFKAASERFQSYGRYLLADPLAPLEDGALIADAIDDIADITSDMRGVVWLADNVGADDAHWSFRLHFFHWGRHARSLAMYLQARIW